MGDATPTTRVKLMVVLPLTMALLVGGAGFFALSMTRRVFEAVPAQAGADPQQARALLNSRLAQLGVQISAISVIAALLGLSIALGVTRPVRRITERLEALASGDLGGALQVASTSELDALGGAVNEAISAIQRYFFQAMTGAVITLDRDGRVIGSSTAAETTLGYREEDLVGRRFSEVFTPTPGSRAALMAVETAIARRQPLSIDDVEILVADGRPVRIGISVSYLQQAVERGAGRTNRTGSGEVVGVMIAFKDLDQMRALRARLQQADQLVALGMVTTGVAHEIRNPLASLRGLAEMLGRDIPPGDGRRKYLEVMLESIDRLNRLVENLLVLSAPGRADAAVIDVSEVVGEAVAMARLGLGDRKIDLAVVPDPPPRLAIRGSRERMLQVLSNLVLNATQATPDGGAVTVRVTSRDDAAVVAVHNTGSYIPPDMQRQLFVPFFTTKPTGTGLGLAIARRIVTSMDGRIEVDSDPSTGTTFTIEVPLAAREEALVV
jgi:PAS domain S-box-containing protein